MRKLTSQQKISDGYLQNYWLLYSYLSPDICCNSCLRTKIIKFSGFVPSSDSELKTFWHVKIIIIINSFTWKNLSILSRSIPVHSLLKVCRKLSRYRNSAGNRTSWGRDCPEVQRFRSHRHLRPSTSWKLWRRLEIWAFSSSCTENRMTHHIRRARPAVTWSRVNR